MSSAQVAAHTLIYLNTLKHVAVAYLHLPCSVPFCILSCTSSFPTIYLDFCSCVLIQSSQSAGFQSADYVVCLLSVHFIFEYSLMVLKVFRLRSSILICSVCEVGRWDWPNFSVELSLWAIRFSASWALAPSSPTTVSPPKIGCIFEVRRKPCSHKRPLLTWVQFRSSRLLSLRLICAMTHSDRATIGLVSWPSLLIEVFL